MGCGFGQDSDNRLPTVRDSLGVQIVESAAPSWRAGEGWTLGSTPRLEIGGDLHEVVGVSVLADGGVVVANMGDNTIRRYDAAGRLLWRVGGPGDGPAEFRQLRHFARVGDEVWGIQVGAPGRAFDLEGNLLRSLPFPPDLPEPVCLNGRFFGIYPDGSRLFSECPTPRIVKGSIWDEVVPFFRLAPTGQRVDLDSLPVYRVVALPDPLVPENQFLGPSIETTVAADRTYTGYPDRWEILEWDLNGRLVRRIRKPWSPVPVSRRHREGFVDLLGASAMSASFRGVSESMLYPDHLPAFGRMIVDATGGLWVERFDPDPPWAATGYVRVPPALAVWDIFDSDGIWLGEVMTPARFLPMEIGTDHVAGVWKDAFDVQHVRVYDLVRR